MSKLRNDIIRVTPKRTLLLSLGVTLIIVALAIFLQWRLLPILSGFWIGVIANLINFRLIVIGSKNFLDKQEQGVKASMIPNLAIRYVIYGLVFFIAWRISTPALVASFIGVSMVSLAIRLDGFFTVGYEKP